jgi:hypothetical protein
MQLKVILLLIVLLGSVLGATGEALDPLLACQVTVHQQKSNTFELKVENAQLRAQLADAQAKIDGATLTEQRDQLLKERTALEKVLIKALGGNDGDSIDWTASPPALKPSGPR